MLYRNLSKMLVDFSLHCLVLSQMKSFIVSTGLRGFHYAQCTSRVLFANVLHCLGLRRLSLQAWAAALPNITVLNQTPAGELLSHTSLSNLL